MKTNVLGYPRIGEKRELKKANVSKKVNTLLTLVILIGNSLTVVYMLLQS